MHSAVSQSVEPRGDVASALGHCPRCNNTLMRLYPSEYPQCLQCGWEDYGEVGRSLAEDERGKNNGWLKGEPHRKIRTVEMTETKHWQGTVWWRGTEYSVYLKYINDEGHRAFIEEIAGTILPRMGDTYRKSSQVHEESVAKALRKAFKEDTGLVLAYVEKWVRENPAQ